MKIGDKKELGKLMRNGINDKMKEPWVEAIKNYNSHLPTTTAAGSN